MSGLVQTNSRTQSVWKRRAAIAERRGAGAQFLHLIQASPNYLQLTEQFGPRFNAEFLALAQERNAEVFFSGLLGLGTRLEQDGRLEAATGVFAWIRDVGASANNSWRTVPLRVLQAAERRMNSILGVGSSGMRAEFLLRRFASEATEPATLIGLGAAATVFRATRLAAWTRLAASPNAGFFTRGSGARALASLAGFGAEATVFPLATRLGHVALGRSLDWSAGQVGSELASSFLVLGAMKLGGWGTARALPTVGARSAANYWRMPLRHVSTAAAQTGMLGGILLGQRLEEAVRLRTHVDGATTLIDSFAMLLQFNIAGNLSKAAFGEWNLPRELSEPESKNSGIDWQKLSPSTVLVNPRAVREPPLQAGGAASEGPAKPTVLMMGLLGRGRGGTKEKVLGIDRGALAIGGDEALNLLLTVRDELEASGISKKNLEKYSLVWVPDHPMKTVLMNELGLAMRPEIKDFEEINSPGRIRIQAVLPLTKPGEYYVFIKDIADRVGDAMQRWRRKKELKMEGPEQWDQMSTQLETLARQKEAVKGIIEEKGKRYLLFENGKKNLLPANLLTHPDPAAPGPDPSRKVLEKYRNQFWGYSPLEMEKIIAAQGMLLVAKNAIISHHIHPNAMILPGFAGPLGTRKDVRFFFMHGRNFFAADLSGGKYESATQQLPPDLFEFLKRATAPRVLPRKAGDSAPIPEKSPDSKTPTPIPAAAVEASAEAPPQAPVDLPAPAEVVSNPSIEATKARLGEAPTIPISKAEMEAVHRDPKLPFADTGEITAGQFDQLSKGPNALQRMIEALLRWRSGKKGE